MPGSFYFWLSTDVSKDIVLSIEPNSCTEIVEATTAIFLDFSWHTFDYYAGVGVESATILDKILLCVYLLVDAMKSEMVCSPLPFFQSNLPLLSSCLMLFPVEDLAESVTTSLLVTALLMPMGVAKLS